MVLRLIRQLLWKLTVVKQNHLLYNVSTNLGKIYREGQIVELLDKLKRLLWVEDDGSEERADLTRGADVASFEASAGKVMLVKPDLYVNVGQVIDYLCEGHLVLLDLAAMTPEEARRIVDFLSGAAYSRDGLLLQVSSKAYLLAPATVDVSDGSRIATGDEWSLDAVFNF